MGSSHSNPEMVLREVADMYAVHRLESSEFKCLPEATERLLECFKTGLVQERAVEGNEGQKNCLLRILRHFIDESLDIGKEGASVPESCHVSVGVIEGNRLLALEPGKFLDVPFTSRERKLEQGVVFCWFIPITTVQVRCCLLTRLTLDELASASPATIVERISHGDLGYYIFRKIEQRLIPKKADIDFLLGSDQITARRECREFEESPCLALFCAKSAMLALLPYRRRFHVAFIC